MSRRVLAGVVTGVTVPLLIAGSAGTAFAANGNQALRQAKRVAQADITKRLHTLNDDVHKVAHSATLTADHRNTLSAIFTNDASILRGLRSQVSSETTLAGVAADVKNIFGETRVYALLGPQVNTVVRADGIIAKASRVTANSSTIVTTTDFEKAQLAHAQTLLSDATKIAGSASSVALGIKPADLPEGLTPIVLVEARSTLSAAADDIGAAQVLIAAIRAHNAES